MKRERLRYGMVGGAKGAFIGEVHRKAIAAEENADLVAACFSQNKEKNKTTGHFYRISEERIYADYKEMATQEAKREDKIDFVCIVTPNVTHYEIAKAFLEAGIHVMCEKPLCFNIEQAEELKDLAESKDLFFGVMYSYSGNAMVKLARKLVSDGEIGDIINVNAEYLQEWLIDEIGGGDQSTTKLSVWRTDPTVAGRSNCIGDIGTHIENTVFYITGLHPRRVSCILDRFGMDLEINANMLVEFEGQVHGVFSCSQVCAGHQNGLVVRIFGTKGAIEWVQEDSNYLTVAKKGEPVQTYHRGSGYVKGRAAEVNHIPSGHPEGLLFAFANVYHSYLNTLLKTINHEPLESKDLDFPTVADGIEGVRFICASISSGENDAQWTKLY